MNTNNPAFIGLFKSKWPIWAPPFDDLVRPQKSTMHVKLTKFRALFQDLDRKSYGVYYPQWAFSPHVLVHSRQSCAVTCSICLNVAGVCSNTTFSFPFSCVLMRQDELGDKISSYLHTVLADYVAAVDYLKCSSLLVYRPGIIGITSTHQYS